MKIDSNKYGILKRISFFTGFIFLAAAFYLAGTLQLNEKFPSSVNANQIFSEQSLDGISEPSAVSDEQNNIEVYRTVAPGVVLITTKAEITDYWSERDEQSGTGSGVVIDKNGHILTNEHVIRGGQRLTVNLGGDKVFAATLVGSDPDTDLAVIKIDAPADQLTVVPVGNSDALTVGQKVLAIGNPFGLDRTLTTGVISGLQRPIRARNNRPIEGAIQTDASINPGNSGGPLLDKFGKMIGINSQILSPSGASNGIGFAIPSSIIQRVVPQLIATGKVERPQLGIATKSVAELIKQGIKLPVEEGLLVIAVAPNSSAEKAGLRGTSQEYDGQIIFGDVITAIDEKPVKSADELYKALDGKKTGETISLEIYRNGSKTNLTVKLENQTGTENYEISPSQKKTRLKRNY